MKAVKLPPRLWAALIPTLSVQGGRSKGSKYKLSSKIQCRSRCSLSFSVHLHNELLKNLSPLGCRLCGAPGWPCIRGCTVRPSVVPETQEPLNKHLVPGFRFQASDEATLRPLLSAVLASIPSPQPTLLGGYAWCHPLKVAQPQKKTFLKIISTPQRNPLCLS